MPKLQVFFHERATNSRALFCAKWPIKIKHPMTPRHPVKSSWSNTLSLFKPLLTLFPEFFDILSDSLRHFCPTCLTFCPSFWTFLSYTFGHCGPTFFEILFVYVCVLGELRPRHVYAVEGIVDQQLVVSVRTNWRGRVVCPCPLYQVLLWV